jgi:putative aldouronate transport system substrate-binding protein
MKMGQVAGVQYGLVEPPPIPKREGYVICKDWLDKLGLKAPTTLDEMFEVAKAFTEKDPDGNGKNDTYGVGGFINGVGLGDRFDFIMGGYDVPGLWDVRDSGNIKLNVRDPNYAKALTFFNKLVTAKVIDPDWPTLKRDDFRARWKQGKFGIMWEDFFRACQSVQLCHVRQELSGWRVDAARRAERSRRQSLVPRRYLAQQHLGSLEKSH